MAANESGASEYIFSNFYPKNCTSANVLNIDEDREGQSWFLKLGMSSIVARWLLTTERATKMSYEVSIGLVFDIDSDGEHYT